MRPEAGMGMALCVKAIVLLTCLKGFVSSTPISNYNVTVKEVISQLNSLNTKRPSCGSLMVWQVNFEKEKPCAALEVLNNITNCLEIEPLKRNMNFLLGNSTRNETCLKVHHTKIQLTKFLKDLHTFFMSSYRNGMFKPRLGNFTKG
ncbi:interleukin-13 [Petaurus breviceps papuanus]|uniref:interleukin-13 n=1 Tax=Petaurus breviceps papuanus TaxID=3040969 RepID=UPI0036DD6C35